MANRCLLHECTFLIPLTSLYAFHLTGVIGGGHWELLVSISIPFGTTETSQLCVDWPRTYLKMIFKLERNKVLRRTYILECIK